MKISTLFVSTLLAVGTVAGSASAEPRLFSTDEAAQAACPGETVVWVELSARTFYTKDQAQFGKGSGAYTCEKEAHSERYRAGK